MQMVLRFTIMSWSHNEKVISDHGKSKQKQMFVVSCDRKDEEVDIKILKWAEDIKMLRTVQ